MNLQAPIKAPLISGKAETIITEPMWVEWFQRVGTTGYTGSLTVVTSVSPTTTKTLTIVNGVITNVT